MLAGAQPFAVFFEVIFFGTVTVANIHRCRFGTSGVGKKEEDDEERFHAVSYFFL